MRSTAPAEPTVKRAVSLASAARRTIIRNVARGGGERHTAGATSRSWRRAGSRHSENSQGVRRARAGTVRYVRPTGHRTRSRHRPVHNQWKAHPDHGIPGRNQGQSRLRHSRGEGEKAGRSGGPRRPPTRASTPTRSPPRRAMRPRRLSRLLRTPRSARRRPRRRPEPHPRRHPRPLPTRLRFRSRRSLPLPTTPTRCRSRRSR